MSDPPRMAASERSRMLAGEPYRPSDPELRRERERARTLLARYNATRPDDRTKRRRLLEQLFGEFGTGSAIEPPFFCDYGDNISIGERVFLNFQCVVLDCARVEIGAGTQIGPAVQICAATHPVDPEQRRHGVELARPIVVGEHVWIGAGAIIGPGVSIGDDSVVGAGSVVVRDVPARVVAAGNPSRVLREL